MDLAQLSIRRPIFISCIVTLILLVGYISLKNMSVDLFPDVTFPVVMVNTAYPGAGPAEVETLVSKVLEEELSGVSGIEKLRSTSKEGLSTVIIEFTLKTDIKAAEQAVRDRVDFAKRKLPDDIESPVIRSVDPADQPIAIVALRADLGPSELYDLAEQIVKPRLEQVNDVGMVNITGGRKREIQLQLDIDRLRGYEISAGQIADKLSAAGQNIPAGKIASTGGKETIYRTVADFRSLDSIKNSIVRFTGNEFGISAGDMGQVVDTLADERSRTFVDGKPALLVMVFRQSGANTIAVVDEVKKAVEGINKRFDGKAGAPNVRMVKDGAQRIRDNVFDVKESIIIGVILTVLVVYFFLGSFRSTIITGLALPNSLLGAFTLMLLAGFSINIMSLLALSLAVGLLIDDAIVVRENIFRHMEMGKDALRAALDGTREVSMAVIATTMAVLAVFTPIGFLSGVTGQFFKEFGLTICFAMAISLFDALTIAPMLSAYFAGSLHPAEPKNRIGRWNKALLKAFDRFQTSLENLYVVVIRWTLQRPGKVLLFNVFLFVFSIYMVKFVPKTFLPTQDNGEFIVGLDLPPGTSLDGMAEVAEKVDKLLREQKMVASTVLTIGNRDLEPNFAEINVNLVSSKKRDMNTTEVKELVRGLLKPYAFANPQVKDGDMTGGGQRQFNLNLIGENLADLEKASTAVLAKLKAHPGLTDVDSSFKPGKPEYQVVLNQENALQAGVTTSTVGRELRALIEGVTPAIFRENDREYDVRVRLTDSQRDLKERADEILVPNINQTMIRLPLIASLKEATGPSSINREDRSRYIQISADMNPNGPGMSATLTDITKLLTDKSGVQLPEGVGFAFVGQAERFKELVTNMAIAAGLGILFIYFVLASLYESLITPFAIMLVLPLAIIGAFLALLVTQSTLDLFSMIGCVMLLGLATKNSILMVDYINQLMERGMNRNDAIIEAGRTRLRPILMTSLALIAGMLPVAIGLNEASKQRTSLGVAVIGGTISSTLLTLVVIPAAFSYIHRFQLWLTRVFNRYVRGVQPT